MRAEYSFYQVNHWLVSGFGKIERSTEQLLKNDDYDSPLIALNNLGCWSCQNEVLVGFSAEAELPNHDFYIGRLLDIYPNWLLF